MILISIFLFAILTLGVASANENLDNLKMDDGAGSQVDDLTDSLTDEVISQDAANEISDGEPKEVDFEFPNEIKAGERFNVNVTMPDMAYGTVYYYFDDYTEDESDFYVSSSDNQFSSKINQMGKHDFHVKFVSDTPEICGDKSATKTYDIVDYGVEIYADNNEWGYGQSNTINAYIPSNIGKAVVDVNGKTYNFDLEEDSVYVYYTALNVSEVNFKVTYKGDGAKLKEKTFSKVFNIIPTVNAPSYFAFGTSPNVTADYVNGEKIKFTVLDGDEINVIDEKTVTVTDSKAIYSIPSNLKFGETYYLQVMYDDSVIWYDSFKINPKMNIPNKFYDKKEYIIPVEFPVDYKNLNLTVSLVNTPIFNGKIGADGKIDLNLSNMELGNDLEFNIVVSDSNMESVFTFFKFVNVWDVDPSSLNLDFRVLDEYVSGETIGVEAFVGDTASGYLIVLVDGLEIDKIRMGDYIPVSIDTKDLKIGVHNLTLKYLGDEYFEPITKEFSFNVVPYIVVIPENLSYNEGKNIGVVFPGDTTGSLILYVDGKKARQWTVEDELDFNDFTNHWSVLFRVEELNLALGPHDFRFVYKGNKQAFDITKKSNLGYSIGLYCDYYIYGDVNTLQITLPEGATGSFKIKIDGKDFKKFTKDNNCIDVDISEFMGSHAISVEYAGDSKYNYPQTVNGTFNVSAQIDVLTYYIPYKSDNIVSLPLPNEAKGNLVLEIDGNIYAKQAVSNGKAEIKFNDLDIGVYDFRAYYDGDDYTVESIVDSFYVVGKVSTSKNDILFNESVDVYLNLPSTVEGDLIVKYSGEEYREKLVNGFAKVTLSNFCLGEQSIISRFESTDGNFDIMEDEHLVNVNPIFDVPDKYVVFSGNTITVYAPSDFKGTLNVEVDGENVASKPVSAGKTSVSLSQLTAGSHFLYIYVMDDSDEFISFSKSLDINVSKAASSKLFATSATVYCGYAYKAKVLGIDGLPIKGAKVTFKVGKNKAVTKTTNAKGIAALAMNYKPAKYTVLVKYAKQTLKPIVIVKKVLALKSVNVKKSAKKLILQATLKKGKVAIKGKVVTFKFNGKTIRAKTNNYGIAKVTISKTVLSKLKVGRNVVYQAIYLKDVAKKSARVKK